MFFFAKTPSIEHWGILFGGIGTSAIAGIVKFLLMRKHANAEKAALKILTQRPIAIRQDENLMIKYELFSVKEQLRNVDLRLDKIENSSTPETKKVIRKAREEDWNKQLEIIETDMHLNKEDKNIQRNLEIAGLSYMSGNLKKADAAVNVVLSLKPDDIEALNSKGHIHRTLGNLKIAYSVFRRMLNAAKEAGDKESESTALSNPGSICVEQNKSDEAEQLYRSALRISLDENDIKGQAYDYCHLAGIYGTRKKLSEAVRLYNKSLSLARKTNDSALQAGIIGNLGVCYEKLGDSKTAEKAYLKALDLAKKIDFKRIIADVLYSLGDLYMKQSRLSKAEATLTESLEIARTIGYKTCISKAYTDLGLVYLGLRDFENAEKMHRESLKIESEFASNEGMARQYFNLGILNNEKGDEQAAIDFITKSRQFYLDAGKSEMAMHAERILREIKTPQD